MEIDIFEDKENKVFNRREIKFYVEYEGEATPKITDIKSKLVALLNSKKESTVVDNVQPHYGEPKALGYAKVYETVEDLEYIETKILMVKKSDLYKVDGDKIERKNPVCPRCSDGVFMADHGNRYACGKCGYTEMKKD